MPDKLLASVALVIGVSIVVVALDLLTGGSVLRTVTRTPVTEQSTDDDS